MHTRRARLVVSLVALCLAAAVSFAAAVAFAGAAIPAPQAAVPKRAIFRVHPNRDRDFLPLLRLGLDVAGSGPGGSLDVVVDSGELERIRALGYTVTPVTFPGRDIKGAPASPLVQPNLGDYHTYAEAHAEMAAYVAAHPSIALLDTIGTSLEGRAIEAVKISDHAAIEEAEPEALVVGCHHARELMSVELPLYLMRRLLDGYGGDPLLTSLVDGRQIWIVPILNPDGYVYVEQNTSGQPDNWWRKNRRPNSDGSVGVDLNRNYGYNWGFDDFGSSPSPASEVYRGQAPFSEPETAAFRDFMAAHAFSLSASFHSYGELVLYPWGFASLDTPDHAVFKALGDSLAAQNGYLAGNPKSGAIYLTNGDMDDWVYGENVAKPQMFGFTFEVNTAADGGFAPNDAFIPVTCDLNWGPLLTLLRYGDEPRRVLPPARPDAPVVEAIPGEGWAMAWGYPSPDPLNPPLGHDVKRFTSLTFATDDAESGTADWDTTLFAWSSSRSASGGHSFSSGPGDLRTSVLEGRSGIDAAAGDSVVVEAYWDLQQNHDYWYGEASMDGGATWSPLAGDRTSNENPLGMNLGNGITGTSGGLFLRAAFSLEPYAGEEVLVRFRCITDATVHGEGLYLDDLSPVAREGGVTFVDTGSPDSIYALTPTPETPTYFQVRAVDGEGQPGLWSGRGIFDPAITGVALSSAPGATRDRLSPGAPNPFNPETRIAYALGSGKQGAYRLDVYDARGRWIALLASGWDDGRGASREARWNGRDARGNSVASGIYLLRLESVRGVRSSKATLLR